MATCKGMGCKQRNKSNPVRSDNGGRRGDFSGNNFVLVDRVNTCDFKPFYNIMRNYSFLPCSAKKIRKLISSNNFSRIAT